MLSTLSSDPQLYYCGPPSFMAAVDGASAHWPAGTVHFEAFQPLEHDNASPEPFTIMLREGTSVPVAADTTALAALRGTGLLLMASCENGVCGTCECGMLEGQPIHRDAFLSRQACDSRFISCVSRAKGVLKLDL